ncbi:hypothetical protein VTL71DRAFT_10398 [Oculimacula yallundae]|uniref:Uncharacterized protein n=1 Tax=Oculimacula yallundae TaxID=86028 RepID=A0ABR4CSW3_9HELO
MPSLFQTLAWTPALIALVSAQGVIQSAQGPKGPASLPYQINLKGNDANIIAQKEIAANVVNACGRTLLGGNIDIGLETENQLIAKTVTQVTAGSTVNVVINQVNADGAGPYTCDLDLKSNANGATGQTKLVVKESPAKDGLINLAVTLPAKMALIGASTGNCGTIRCFNAAAAGPFGGCVAVQQTDEKANQNTVQNINTAQGLAATMSQIQQNQMDLAAANAGIANAAKTEDQGPAVIDTLLKIDSKAAAKNPAAAANAAPAATPAAGAAAGGAKAGGAKAGAKKGAKKGAAKGGAAAAKAKAAAAKKKAAAAKAKAAAGNKRALFFSA